ncbi:MAG TPA: hypothetical protein VEP90_21680 [Methylomirabilota bacterium]|nr:hypothetical protein [Methylomirabilota bacterium]
MRKSVFLMTKKVEVEDRIGIVMASGLLAISLLIFSSLVSSASLDTPQFISLLAFATSIPMLATAIALTQFELSYRCYSENSTTIGNTIIVFGFLATILGVFADIWHLSWIASLLFIVVSLTMTIITINYVSNPDFKYQEKGDIREG